MKYTVVFEAIDNGGVEEEREFQTLKEAQVFDLSIREEGGYSEIIDEKGMEVDSF